jgi:hypothetical protein
MLRLPSVTWKIRVRFPAAPSNDLSKKMNYLNFMICILRRENQREQIVGWTTPCLTSWAHVEYFHAWHSPGEKDPTSELLAAMQKLSHCSESVQKFPESFVGGLHDSPAEGLLPRYSHLPPSSSQSELAESISATIVDSRSWSCDLRSLFSTRRSDIPGFPVNFTPK